MKYTNRARERALGRSRCQTEVDEIDYSSAKPACELLDSASDLAQSNTSCSTLPADASSVQQPLSPVPSTPKHSSDALHVHSSAELLTPASPTTLLLQDTAQSVDLIDTGISNAGSTSQSVNVSKKQESFQINVTASSDTSSLAMDESGSTTASCSSRKSKRSGRARNYSYKVSEYVFLVIVYYSTVFQLL